jgi:thiol-disulfide isomerase/thioredoxin
VSLFGAHRHPRTAALPVEGHLPSFDGATGWLNSSPLTPAELSGRVVLVDFWTYTCINWLRTLAFVRAWAAKYRDLGLVVIGVHTPEFPFEREVDNVRGAAQNMRVEYPVALDSDYGVWSAFANRYWPAVYLADAEGRIRYHHFGEGEYDEGEWMIQHLLSEGTGEGIDHELVSVAPDGFEAQADWTNLRSPETYLGYTQGQNLDSPGGVAYDEPRSYLAPESLQLNTWALAGNWTIEEGASVLNEAGGESSSASMPATSISSCGRGRARSSRSTCWSTAKRPPQPTGWTSTRRAGERWSSHGSISWCASPGRSRTARSRSHSSIRASRRTCSPSARRARPSAVPVHEWDETTDQLRTTTAELNAPQRSTMVTSEQWFMLDIRRGPIWGSCGLGEPAGRRVVVFADTGVERGPVGLRLE